MDSAIPQAPSASPGRLARALRRPLVACLVLFLFAWGPRLAFLVHSGVSTDSGDVAHYLQMAETIWNDGVYGRDARRPSSEDHVLYCVFLAPFVGLFGPAPFAALVVQTILAAMCAALAYLTARRLAGDLAGWAAGLLYCAYLPMVAHPARHMTETLSVFWMFLALLSLVEMFRAERIGRASLWAALLGAVLALLALTRLIAFPLVLIPLALYPLANWRSARRGAPVAAACLAGFALAYSPWVVRNYLTFDRLILLDGKQSIGRGVAVGGANSLKYLMQGIDREEARRLAKEEADRRAEELEASGQTPPEPKRISRLSPTNLKWIWQRFLIMMGWHPHVDARYPLTGHAAGAMGLVRPLVFAWHWLMYPLVLGGVALAWMRRDMALLTTFLLPAALLCLYSIVHAIVRYQIPIFSAWCVPAGVAAAALLSRLLSGRSLKSVRQFR